MGVALLAWPPTPVATRNPPSVANAAPWKDTLMTRGALVMCTGFPSRPSHAIVSLVDDEPGLRPRIPRDARVCAGYRLGPEDATVDHRREVSPLTGRVERDQRLVTIPHDLGALTDARRRHAHWLEGATACAPLHLARADVGTLIETGAG